MESAEIKETIRQTYSNVADQGCGCDCGCGPSIGNADASLQVGYSSDDVSVVPDANLGLGCGNPTALGRINEGEAVLDLGSGAGFDSFLAANKVGDAGKVIGVDMTENMISKAMANARKYNYSNVEFRLGDIEDIPVADDSMDVIISNCVINLAPDKSKVYREANRVLKSEGRMYISDIVLLRDVTDEQRNDLSLIAGCVSGAMLRDEYLNLIEDAGFKVNIISEVPGAVQDNGIELESLNIEAIKL